jgi:hypothetical protein
VQVSTVVIGELGHDARQRLADNPLVRLAPPAAAARRGGFLAELGWRRAQAGDPGDPRLVDAFYVS